MSVASLTNTSDHATNYETLDSIDLLEKCGEIFLQRQLGSLIYLCSLCDDKFENVEIFSKHLSDVHISVESFITYEPNESDEDDQFEESMAADPIDELETNPIEELILKEEVNEENLSEESNMNADDVANIIGSSSTALDIQVYVDELHLDSEIKEEEEEEEETVSVIDAQPLAETTPSEKVVYHNEADTTDLSDKEILHSKFKCKFCGEQFDYVKELRKHDCGFKKIGKLHHCSVCGKVFKKKSGCDTHMMIHMGEKPYKCDLCKASYACKQNLIVHIRRHTGEKPFKCTFCERTFASSTEKISHMRTHTGERPYVCEMCGKAHISSSQLTEHMYRHLDIRNHPCDLCDKRFRNSYNLRMHRLTHIDAPRKFSCEHCLAAFKTQNNLLQHQKIHQEKNYVCKICGRAFAQHPGLYSHMKSHAISK